MGYRSGPGVAEEDDRVRDEDAEAEQDRLVGVLQRGAGP